MNITDRIKYSVCYRGRCKPGFTSDQVEKNISDLFNVDVSEVKPIFSGKTFFLKTHLNIDIAEQFSNAFSKAGAICEVREEIKCKDKHMEADVLAYLLTCPQCNNTQVNGEECKKCGIIFNKYKKKQGTFSGSDENKNAGDKSGDQAGIDFEKSKWNQEKSRARLFLKYGTTTIIGFFLIDAVAQFFGIDFGIMPYLAGNIALGYGGYLIAKTKGYHEHILLAAVLGVIGLCIVVILPDKTKPDIKKVWGLPEFSSIAILFIALYFGSSYLVNSSHFGFSKYSRFMDASKNFQKGRHYYPSRIPDSYAVEYERNISSLLDYTEKGFELIKEGVLRPSEEGDVSDRMFEEISKLFGWFQYQQFLHMQLEIPLPESLSQENFKKTMKQFLSMFDFYLNNIGQPGEHRKFSISYLEWFHHCLDYDRTAFVCRRSGSHPGVKLMQYVDSVRGYIVRRRFYDDILDLSEKQFANLPEIPQPPEGMLSSVKIDENGVFIFKTSPNMPEGLADKTIHMFRGLKPYSFGSSSNDLVYICIGGTLPQKYISLKYSVFDTWKNFLYFPD